MSTSEPLTTYLELRASAPDGSEGAGLSHTSEGLVLLHVLELAAFGEPRGGVTLVHDAGDHGGRYLAAARAFAERGWAVALPDLRGHGRSEGVRGHSAGRLEVFRDLQSIQDHLAYRLPDAPKLLVGQGLGALYAAAFALERPGAIAGLALLAPTWEPRYEPPAAPKGLRKLFARVGPESAGRTGTTAAALTSDVAAQRAWDADEHAHDAITLRAVEEARALARLVREGLSELDLPVLVLHGAQDALAPPAVSRGLQGARLEVDVLEGARHDLLHEADGDRTAQRIADWLDGAVA